MAGIKNKYDFYKGFLEALGAENITETDYKNEEELRKRILDTLDVEYVFDDVNQTDLFREKFLQGISSGGGGGSSDFSTAEVTFICNDSTLIESPVDFNGAFYGVDDRLETPIDATMPYIGFYGSETVKQILLYKGNAILTIGDSVDEIDSTSGSIEAVGLGMYKISGNCTIHYTPVGEAL